MEEIEREIDLEPQYYRPFLETARSIFDDEVYALVHEALRLAVDRLKGMARHDGTPLVAHSINTAMIVIREVGLGRNSTISTLLHDVVRLQLMDVYKIGNRFGEPKGEAATSNVSGVLSSR